jgi:hypothetical protein
MPREQIGGSLQDETLVDKTLVTLSSDRFLVATEEETRAISRLINTLGHDDAIGVIVWHAARTDEMFLDGGALVAALEGWLATSSPASIAEPQPAQG